MPLDLAAIIVPIAVKLAGDLAATLQTPGQAPSATLLGEAIERLVSIGLFNTKGKLDMTKLAEATPGLIQRLLENLISTRTDPFPMLSAVNLKNRLMNRCQGTPDGTTFVPPNRQTFAPEPGGLRANYLYKLDMGTVPATLGLAPDVVEKIVQGAWQRWQVIVAPKLRVQQWSEVHVHDPNMLILFGQLDGNGNELAVTRTETSGGVSQFTITIDVSESWDDRKLMATLVHELGHALGLEHVENDPSAIMSAVLNPTIAAQPVEKILLTDSDIKALSTQGTPWV